MKPLILAILILFFLVLLARVFRKRIIKFLMKVKVKLHIRSLRVAIKDADKDKAETDRKNMVAFNTESHSFEPLQKKMLKNYANARKNKSNAKMTDGRKWALEQKRKTRKPVKRSIDPELIKKIEKESLYVTK